MDKRWLITAHLEAHTRGGPALGQPFVGSEISSLPVMGLVKEPGTPLAEGSLF